jgi:hypothetical protein
LDGFTREFRSYPFTATTFEVIASPISCSAKPLGTDEI